MKTSKLLLATLGASVLLGALVGNASARTFSTSSQTFRTAYRVFGFRGAFGEIKCGLTLEGSLHSRTIAKVRGTLIGLITRAELGTCILGTMTILAGLPWHVRYDSFGGTLPNITFIKVRALFMTFRVREPLLTCLATTTEEAPGIITFDREVATRALTTSEFSGTGIETTCGRVGEFESSRDLVTVLGSSTRITVTLI
jgi:hypothetical protein